MPSGPARHCLGRALYGRGVHGYILRLALNLPLLKASSIIGVYWGQWSQRNPERFQAEMAQLLDWLAQGKLRPAIAAHYAFTEAPDAIARMTARSVVGKLVVTVDADAG